MSDYSEDEAVLAGTSRDHLSRKVRQEKRAPDYVDLVSETSSSEGLLDEDEDLFHDADGGDLLDNW